MSWIRCSKCEIHQFYLTISKIGIRVEIVSVDTNCDHQHNGKRQQQKQIVYCQQAMPTQF